MAGPGGRHLGQGRPRRATRIGWRSQLGDVHVYDPSRHHRLPPVRVVTAGRLHDLGRARRGLRTTSPWPARRPSGTGMNLADFWFGGAAKALAPYLFAAAPRAAASTTSPAGSTARNATRSSVYSRPRQPDAALAHQATFRREDRARSSLFQVMQQILSVYLDPVVAASAETPRDRHGRAARRRRPHPLRDRPHPRPGPLPAPVRRGDPPGPHRACSSGRPDQPLAAPLLLVLDEAANIAPVEDLPTVASTAAAMGLQLVTVFQDVAQIKDRYGDAAGTIVNNHRAKLFLPGISDLDTLDLTSRLVGEHETDRDSITTRHHRPPIEHHGLALAPAAAPRAGPPTQRRRGRPALRQPAVDPGAAPPLVPQPGAAPAGEPSPGYDRRRR